MSGSGVTENEFEGQNDLEHIFDEISEDLFDHSLVSNISSSSPDCIPLTIDDLDQFLMGDYGEGSRGDAVVEEQQMDFYLDYLLDSPVESDHSAETVDFTEGGKNENSPSSSEEDLRDVLPLQENNGDGDDPTGKKRLRQLRNRDAAVRSRERKKMYVRDLEMKSKYLEGECRRLGMLLQGCCAENHALRLSLQNVKAFDASITKQESAVLSLESLLLGSLLWFLGIVCLLIRPGLVLFCLETVQPGSVDKKKQGSLTVRKAGSKVFGVQLLRSFMVSKRCKASRSRMKPSFFIPEVLVRLSEAFLVFASRVLWVLS